MQVIVTVQTLFLLFFFVDSDISDALSACDGFVKSCQTDFLVVSSSFAVLPAPVCGAKAVVGTDAVVEAGEVTADVSVCTAVVASVAVTLVGTVVCSEASCVCKTAVVVSVTVTESETSDVLSEGSISGAVAHPENKNKIKRKAEISRVLFIAQILSKNKSVPKRTL